MRNRVGEEKGVDAVSISDHRYIRRDVVLSDDGQVLFHVILSLRKACVVTGSGALFPHLEPTGRFKRSINITTCNNTIVRKAAKISYPQALLKSASTSDWSFVIPSLGPAPEKTELSSIEAEVRVISHPFLIHRSE